jgi:hypothetical protein
MTVEIERLIYGSDYETVALKRCVWTVYVDLPFGGGGSPVIKIHEYKEQHRESKRHKWKNDDQRTCYNRLDNRAYWQGYGRSVETVPWDDALLSEVAQKVSDAIKNAKVVLL